MTRGKYGTRERDEEILTLLRLRSQGLSLRQAARQLGVPAKIGQIQTVTERVRKADEAEAAFWGDTPEQAAEGYW